MGPVRARKIFFSNTRQGGSKRKVLDRQSGSKAEGSVTKLTKAEKCTAGVCFEEVIV